MERKGPEGSGIGSLWGRILDLVYPGFCHLCGDSLRNGSALCESCSDDLPGLSEPFCGICGECFDGAVEGNVECPNCAGQSFAFEFARPALVRSPGAMTLVHDLKYGRRLELARELARLAERAFEDPRLAVALREKWPLVPVPLHRKRFRWRFFNQAHEVACPLGLTFGLPVVGALKRVRPTVTQTRLSRSQRQKNLRGAFEVRADVAGGGGVVLVDDVLTTGSTVNECARVLKRSGVQKVIVVTVMRG